MVVTEETALEPSQAAALEAYGIAIDDARSKAARSVLEMGKALHAAQKLLARHGDGTFGRWVSGRCDMSRTWAYQLIDVYEGFGDCPVSLQTKTTALLSLLGAGVPEEARAEAKQLMNAGQPITTAVARDLIDKHSEPSADPLECEYDAPDHIADAGEMVEEPSPAAKQSSPPRDKEPKSLPVLPVPLADAIDFVRVQIIRHRSVPPSHVTEHLESLIELAKAEAN